MRSTLPTARQHSGVGAPKQVPTGIDPRSRCDLRWRKGAKSVSAPVQHSHAHRRWRMVPRVIASTVVPLPHNPSSWPPRRPAVPRGVGRRRSQWPPTRTTRWRTAGNGAVDHRFDRAKRAQKRGPRVHRPQKQLRLSTECQSSGPLLRPIPDPSPVSIDGLCLGTNPDRRSPAYRVGRLQEQYPPLRQQGRRTSVRLR